jgi:putative hydrolase of the HAD superfamily
MPDRPQVIFFDAVGTLFTVKASVGHAYQSIAARHGVETNPQTLNWGFSQAFKAATPLAFPGVEPIAIPALEYNWWREIAIATFNAAEVLMLFDDFDAFFADLFQYFATAAPWEIYPDTIATLNALRTAEIPLGIISNFDSRLDAVLQALELAPYFTSVTIATTAGAAKPSPSIFHTALAQHNCRTENAWHIGDSLEEDYRAACAIGLRGIWIDRSTPNKTVDLRQKPA